MSSDPSFPGPVAASFPVAASGDPGAAASPPVVEPTAAGVPLAAQDLAAYDTPPASSSTRGSTQVGDVVTFEDFDMVTETTTTRHALVVGVDETVAVPTGQQNPDHENVPALSVVFLPSAVTLPADAFTV